MTDIAIRCQKLSKQYRIGERESYTALRDVIAEAAAAPFRRLRAALDRRSAAADGRPSSGAGPSANNGHRSSVPGAPSADGLFWALEDVSFDVKQGEVVGIIGRNGAGKSTMLKILSRITKPTKGHAEIHGRVGSLLEVGTGFHPELTGRENIYLNAAILGMRRAEVERKFDEIVAFAEVEKFIDTPVKRFSSGMYVRLAFAVAAHMETEILLVDEVLAVGDSAFQKKCLGKMGEVAEKGRTVLFVSHNMQAITQLTHRCILFSKGKLAFDGETSEGVALYLDEDVKDSGSRDFYTAPQSKAGNYVASARVHTSEGNGLHLFGEPISFEFALHIEQPQESLCFSFNVKNSHRHNACYFWLFDSETNFGREAGTFLLRCEIPKFRLYKGNYTLYAWLSERRGHTYLEVLRNICPFEVSMSAMPRAEYDWVPDLTTYLEDGTWAPVQFLKSGQDVCVTESLGRPVEQ